MPICTRAARFPLFRVHWDVWLRLTVLPAATPFLTLCINPFLSVIASASITCAHTVQICATPKPQDLQVGIITNIDRGFNLARNANRKCYEIVHDTRLMDVPRYAAGVCRAMWDTSVGIDGSP